MAWINKILFTKEGQNVPTEHDIGTTFDQVRLNSNAGSLTLKTLYTDIKNFFTKSMFMLYSKNEPAAWGRIMEWYEISVVDNGQAVQNPESTLFSDHFNQIVS